MIKIVIIDGQEGYRNQVCDYLSNQKDFKVAGAGSDSYEAIKLVDTHKPDIVLMDMELPQGDSIKTAALVKYRSPHTSVIISGNNKAQKFFSGFLNGISGYITKQENSELLCHAIRAVYYGGSLVSPDFFAQISTIVTRSQIRGERQNSGKNPDASTAELPYTISPIEIQIMGYLGQGCTNKEIAEKLHLSEGTIRNYVSTVLQKTGFRDRTQAAIFAVKAGL